MQFNLAIVAIALSTLSSSTAQEVKGVDEHIQHEDRLFTKEIEVTKELHLGGTHFVEPSDSNEEGDDITVDEEDEDLSITMFKERNCHTDTDAHLVGIFNDDTDYSSDEAINARKLVHQQEEKVRAKATKANTFKPPKSNSSRGSCPAMNTLANHGFINRDGKDVDINDLAYGLEEVF